MVVGNRYGHTHGSGGTILAQRRLYEGVIIAQALGYQTSAEREVGNKGLDP